MLSMSQRCSQSPKTLFTSSVSSNRPAWPLAIAAQCPAMRKRSSGLPAETTVAIVAPKVLVGPPRSSVVSSVSCTSASRSPEGKRIRSVSIVRASSSSTTDFTTSSPKSSGCWHAMSRSRSSPAIIMVMPHCFSAAKGRSAIIRPRRTQSTSASDASLDFFRLICRSASAVTSKATRPSGSRYFIPPAADASSSGFPSSTYSPGFTHAESTAP